VHFCRNKRPSYRSRRKRNNIVLLDSLLLCHVFPQGIKDLYLELLVHYRSWPKGTNVHPPSAIISVCLSVSSSDFVSAITFNTIKGMMKPGMWQYVDYARILAHLSTMCSWWAIVVGQCFECGYSRKPDCAENFSKCLSVRYLGKVRIWLLTCQNLGHPGVLLD